MSGFEFRVPDNAFGVETYALTQEALKKSIKLGVVSFVPKDKMSELRTHLEDVVMGEGRPVWQKLFDRLGSYFNKHFGLDWKERINFLRSRELHRDWRKQLKN